ncbi:MAG: amidohydrolase family protein, partial [Ferruginibacter sp.]|nr:amidohydrolase family protein [Ferruginibacter sp.]
AEDELYQNKTGDFLSLYKNFGIDIASFEPTGKTSLQSWLPYFTNNQSIISVHNTFASQADIVFASQHPHLYFCLCINANKYIEQKIPPIDLLRKNNANIVLGTDSYASNWQLNIVEEIKSIQQATSYSIPLQEILQWATINGAHALQMDTVLGSFEKGKKPGVVLIQGLNGLLTTASSFASRML